MVDTESQKMLANGWVLGIFAYFIHIIILQYLYNVPALCLECYLDWNMYWDRWWETWTAVFSLVPFMIWYTILYWRVNK